MRINKAWLITTLVAVVLGILILNKLRKGVELHSQEVVVYASSSFLAEWGCGPLLASEFEKQSRIKIRFVDFGDSKLLVDKLQSEAGRRGADLIVGVDQSILTEAQQSIKWIDFESDVAAWNPQLPESARIHGQLVAYDWAPFSFIYREGEIDPPTSLDSLKDPKYKRTLSVIDPRTSLTGFQLLDWIDSIKRDETESFLKNIQPSFFAVSPSWSVAYGLFSKGNAKLVFSYVTSAAYHWLEEKNQKYKVAELQEPLPIQVEYVGVLKDCSNCEGAKAFAKFLLSPQGQSIIMNKNFMLPVVDGVTQNTVFETFGAYRVMGFKLGSKTQVDQSLSKWKLEL